MDNTRGNNIVISLLLLDTGHFVVKDKGDDELLCSPSRLEFLTFQKRKTALHFEGVVTGI
jgi:hypothetical protein